MSEEQAWRQRLAYLDIGEQDIALLRELRPVFEKHADSLVDSFYRHLLSFSETRNLLRDPVVKQRLLAKQREYLISLGGPALDPAYYEDRRQIGLTHERIGLRAHWYLGAYSLYLSLLTPIVSEFWPNDVARTLRAAQALQKLFTLDAGIAIEAYEDQRLSEIQSLADELASAGLQREQTLREQSDELQRTRRRARAAEELASVGTLVAGLAHEIGTPMGVIQGHAKMLESAVSSDDGRWRLRTIQEQISRISRIIQTLLNLARPREMRRAPVALDALLENTLGFVREKLGRRKIEVEAKLGPAPSVVGDAERLQQVFLNLFLNAADAMPDGGTLRVILDCETAGEVQVRVADSGLGIRPEDLPRIFDPFFTSKDAGHGNGLGLTVAKGIVGDHGGVISVESAVGLGTEFKVRFPSAGRAHPGRS
jgi:signal transduction histidine kinase